MPDQKAVHVERQRLTVGNAGQPFDFGAIDAEDHVMIAVEHAVGDGRHGELANRYFA
jgi:hypothetical protein